MISALNHLRLLNGNKRHLIFCLFSSFMFLAAYNYTQAHMMDISFAKANPNLLVHYAGINPTEPAKEGKTQKTAKDNSQDSIAMLYPEIKKDRYCIALFLPLYAKVAEPDKSQKSSIDLARDFYRGLLIACDTMKRCGYNFDIHIYDSENTSVNPKTLADTLKKINTDLIIGPLLEGKNSFVDSVAQSLKINIVSPIINSDKKYDRTYRFESIPTANIVGQRTAEMVKKNYSDYNLILINEKKTTDNATAKAFAASFSKDSLTVIDFLGRTVSKTPPEIPLKDSNIIFIPSNNEAFVSTVLGLIRVKEEHCKIIGLLPWQFFKTIEGNLWEKYNIHLACSYFINYNDPALNGFISNYRNKYNDEPTVWAFIGFDEIAYYGKMLSANGKYFQRALLNTPSPSMHTYYRLNPFGKEGWKNTHVNMLEFHNYKLQRSGQ